MEAPALPQREKEHMTDIVGFAEIQKCVYSCRS